jgi:hypothetical protein
MTLSASYFFQQLSNTILLSKDNSYLGWIRWNFLGKNIYKVPKYVIIGKSFTKEKMKRGLKDNKSCKYSLNRGE